MSGSDSRRQGRRRFLGSLGAAAGMAALGSAAPVRAEGDDQNAQPEHAQQRSDRFGRIFHLPPFADATPPVKEALLGIGRPGGLLDAHDDLSAGPVAHVFEEAQRLLRWHYQWLIVQEFLPLFIGQALVDKILKYGRVCYTPQRAVMPVEFGGAAYRFGHSMVRPSYRANLAGDNGKPFFGLIFDPSHPGGLDPTDMSGGARAPRRFVGWQTFFDFGDGQVKHNKRIGARISTPLFHLPLGAIASHDLPTALPQRTLLRHLTCLAARPDWRPTLPSRFGRGEFHMLDLLAFARVDPAGRGQ